jgi:hypothetical protein
MLYVTTDQRSAETVMEKRIKRSMRCSAQTAKEYREAQATQHDIAFPGMDFRVTWPRAKLAFKQDGWAVVLCDELSAWPDYSPDMARRRTDSYPFPHIVFLSSPDPAQRRSSDDVPIFKEFNRGDMCEWMMPDPAGGEFRYEMGRRGEYGLQWDGTARREDGTWDYEKVDATAYYLTPRGSRIENSDRLTVMRSGHFVPTNKDAPPWCKSIHVTSFMSPFTSCDFGKIAVAFLKAQAEGKQALRGFVYEYLAEPFWDEKEEIKSDYVADRQGSYKRGTIPSEAKEYAPFYIGKKLMVFTTVDVQKDSMWYVIREHCSGGDSGLIEYAEVNEWEKIKEQAARYRNAKALIDNSYEGRRDEVFEQCVSGVMRGAIPCFGRDTLNMPIDIKLRDPFEGSRKQGRQKIHMVTFNPDQIKHVLIRLVTGQHPRLWRVYDKIDGDFVRQMMSEPCINGHFVAQHKRNHIWDCEVLQLVASKIFGLFSDAVIMPVSDEVKEKPKEEDKKQQPKQTDQWINPNLIRL